MPPGAITNLVDTLRDCQILTEQQMSALVSDLQARFPDTKMLARELIQRGWLTPYQVNQIASGRGRELLLGPYLLLERLGQGGMGQVFKARHQLMHRQVALKLMRQDRLGNADVIARFRREIRAAARLSHPNVVIAHDAGQEGKTFYFAMEYIEGTDLNQLVKKLGPLLVEQACTCLHQALQGLQHALQCGLVHRDIKPANLIVTADGSQVKLLDYGLARLNEEEGTGELTAVGLLMGTPDYIAPEQIDDFHRADIRSDIYSLGCTFYYLLTGKPPFAGGSIQEKLSWHREIYPVPVEAARPEVPRLLARVVQTMMAKRPQDRYQTPAEAAQALEPFCHKIKTETWLGAPPPTPGRPPTHLTEGERSTGNLRETFPGDSNRHAASAAPSRGTTRSLTALITRRPVWLAAAAALVLIFTGAGWLIVQSLMFPSPQGEQQAKTSSQHQENAPTEEIFEVTSVPPPAGNVPPKQPGPTPPGLPLLQKGDLLFKETFDSLTGTDLLIPVTNGQFGRKDGKYIMEVFKGSFAGHALLSRYGDEAAFDCLSEVRLQFFGGQLAVGFRLLGEEPRTQLVLLVRPDGSWQIHREWARKVGKQFIREKTKLIQAYQPEEPVLKEGQWNDLTVSANGKDVAIYTNGKLLIALEDDMQPDETREPAIPLFFVGIASIGGEAARLEIDHIHVWSIRKR